MPLPSNEELGELMQQFYMSLLNADPPESGSSSADVSSGSGDNRHYLSVLIGSINHLEDTLLYADLSDAEVCADSVPEEVTMEVVRDCQKKAAAAIRTHYADTVRGIIFTCRKQLRSKTNTKEASSGGGGGELGQRHLNAMVELLGE